MEVLEFGYSLLWVAAGITAAIVLLAVTGLVLRSRRWVVAARVGFYLLFVVVAGASACLVHGIVAGVYNNDYIFSYSERELEPFFKFAGLWAGLDGSLLFWTLVLAAVSAAAALQHHWSARHPTGRRVEPFVYLVLASVLGFFVAVTLNQNPFEILNFEKRQEYSLHFGIDLDSKGNLTDGKGLNPQLVNYWFVFHPPCLYLGLVTFTIPFAFALAALLAGELGDYWVRVTRRWAMAAWLFLTCGIILGGLWAYRQLGWGGYWAWDPVENASFLPWCAATAFLHSIIIQERRDMLKWWNVFLVAFAFFLTIEATYMTRSGEVASVHAFAGGNIGIWFRVFKWVIVGVSLFLIFLRFRDLRGSHRLESILSREAFFFFNNLVLVTIAVAIWFLSWLPRNSLAYLAETKTFGPEEFNLVMVPLFLLLLALTAVGPGLGWVKSSARSLRKNFTAPLLAAFAATACFYAVWLIGGEIHSAREVFLPKPLEDWDALWGPDANWRNVSKDVYYAHGIYPTGIVIFLASLIIATVALEFARGVRSRMQFRKEDVVTAFLSLFTRDNRRYGGYIVHIGIGVLTFGIIISAMFRTEIGDDNEGVKVKLGESVVLGPYLVTPVRPNRSHADLQAMEDGLRRRTLRLEDVEPGLPYLRDTVLFRVNRPAGGSGTKTAHGQASRDPSLSSSAEVETKLDAQAPGELVCELEAERRFYPKQNQWIREPTIDYGVFENIYIFYHERDANGEVSITAYINPFVSGIWAGWVIMILGGLVALMPFSGKKVGLSE
jgi:cytochrome c-type biogenesis protein CcmF